MLAMIGLGSLLDAPRLLFAVEAFLLPEHLLLLPFLLAPVVQQELAFLALLELRRLLVFLHLLKVHPWHGVRDDGRSQGVFRLQSDGGNDRWTD